MDQYCVVVCGLRAGASDEASTWAPVAAALRMEHDEFSRRVAGALPRIVRQQLDRASAERIAQLLQGLQVDARALPGDDRLVYIERDGRSRGPLPRSSLQAFIAPGESYRLHGSLAWQTWPQPPEHASSSQPAQASDAAMAAPVDAASAAAPAAPIENESPAPVAATASAAMPPPLPAASSPATVAPMPDDGLVPDDALINPPSDEPVGDADADALPAGTAAQPPRRSRRGRVLLLLVLVGVAAWAYLHWGAGTHVDDSPPPAPVSHARPAHGTSAAAAPAASSAAAGASSTPAAATSAPASGGTAALPAAAATTAAPAAASSAVPAASSSAVPPASSSAAPAHAASAPATHTAPAVAGSSPPG